MPRPPRSKEAEREPGAADGAARPRASTVKATATTKTGKTLARPAGPAPKRLEVAFPKKNQPPTAAAFAARLPLALGKRFEAVRSFLLKQPGVTEDVYFYGAKSGWALRYLVEGRPLCSLHLHGDRPMGIVSLVPGALAAVDWRALSPVGQRARKVAHGSPSLLWVDVPLDGDGAGDFKALLRAKIATMAPPEDEDDEDDEQDEADDRQDEEDDA
jgi:hypothetical protein